MGGETRTKYSSRMSNFFLSFFNFNSSSFVIYPHSSKKLIIIIIIIINGTYVLHLPVVQIVPCLREHGQTIRSPNDKQQERDAKNARMLPHQPVQRARLATSRRRKLEGHIQTGRAAPIFIPGQSRRDDNE